MKNLIIGIVVFQAFIFQLEAADNQFTHYEIDEFSDNGLRKQQRPVNTALNLQDFVDDTEIKLHPNPASSNINVVCNCEIREIMIYNVFGEIVLNELSNGKSIDISQLETGVYSIVVNEKYSKKLVKI